MHFYLNFNKLYILQEGLYRNSIIFNDHQKLKAELKNFWNLFLLITATIAIGFYLWLNYLSTHRIETINYDPELDAKELSLCNEYIPQYYSVSTDYDGGKRAIKNELMPYIEKEKIFFEHFNGNISIRFILNCKGEIGLFRAKVIDQNLQETSVNQAPLDALIRLVSQLNHWRLKPKKDGTTYDSYYFINFKIRKGLVTDIF